MSGRPLLWLTLLFSFGVAADSYSQSNNFEDGFEDGDFTQNHSWSGDTDDFDIKLAGQNHLLWLDGNSADGGVSYLSVPSADSLGEWEFYIRLDFPPSGSNKAEIFLMSDIPNLEGPVNGYALLAGESGSEDLFHLIRYDDGIRAETVLSGTTDISGGGDFRLKVTRETGGVWKLEAAEGYDGILTPEGGTHADATHHSAGFLGVRATYTSSRYNLFAFDFKIDFPPFTILNATAEARHLDITFNRAFDRNTVQPENFSVSGGTGPVTSIDFPSPDVARLTFADPLASGRYTVTARDIHDQNGNGIAGDSSETFVVFGSHGEGDIVINEFMYDPPDSGLPEYIELKNLSDKFLNLQNWLIGDASNSELISADTLAFPPHSFLVISQDTAALRDRYGERPFVEPQNLPALDNRGDAVKIVTSGGEISDSLAYTPAWGGTDAALERRSTSISAIYRENWGVSPNPGAGTPGLANDVLRDETAPVVLKLSALSKSELQLIFSERVANSNESTLSRYRISPDRKFQRVSVHVDTITIFLADPLLSGESYTVTVAGVADIFGNESSSSSHEVSFLQITEPRRGDIVINEIMPAPAMKTPEFIELFNRSEKNIDLAGWILGDGTDEVTLPPETTLRSHGYLVLTGSAPFGRTQKNAVVLADFPSLNNSGDLLFLRTPRGGATIDSLHYRASWGNRAEEQSLERKDPFAASNDPSNWKSNTSGQGNSAGRQNFNFEVDESPPEVLFATIRRDGQLEVRFSEFIQRTGNLRFSINGVSLSVSSFDTTKADKIILQPPAGESGSAVPSILVEHLADFRGNMRKSSKIPLARPLQAGDLVVNEIMYRPIRDAEDNKADQSEYVELYNASNRSLSLEGMILHDAPDEEGRVQKMQPVSTTAKWVLPRETVLVYSDPSPAFAQSDLAAFFDLDTTRAQAILRVNQSGLGLSPEDAVYIADSSGATIDSVHYSDAWHNPNLLDTRGIALERITPDSESDAGENWSSSVHPRGGTPNAQNSIHQEVLPQHRETDIHFTPNPFSPDGDGYEDNLVISYKLDQPDYLLHVQIFDRYGRYIKELADGKPAGYEGSLVWDGRTDDGRRNRIGIYIVVFEAYDSASGNDEAFKKAVVLARKLN